MYTVSVISIDSSDFSFEEKTNTENALSKTSAAADTENERAKLYVTEACERARAVDLLACSRDGRRQGANMLACVACGVQCVCVRACAVGILLCTTMYTY